MPLYHYTCAHHHQAITAGGGLLRPAIIIATKEQRRALRSNPYASWTSQLVWLTTIPHLTSVNRQAAGLAMDGSLEDGKRRRSPNPPRPCDRTGYRWEVTEEEVRIEPWGDLRAFWPRWLVLALEAVPGVRPETWWVSRGPLQARFSPNRSGAELERAAAG
jgi:hypothetical protein